LRVAGAAARPVLVVPQAPSCGPISRQNSAEDIMAHTIGSPYPICLLRGSLYAPTRSSLGVIGWLGVSQQERNQCLPVPAS
jgi:hypothetical protein